MLQLRYASFDWGGAEVPALIICAQAMDEVLQVAEIALNYYETPGPKAHPDIRFNSTPDGAVSFSYRYPGAGDVFIERVDREIARNLTSALHKVRDFLILLAFGEPMQFVSPKTFYVARSAIQIDDQVVSGLPSTGVDLSGLLSEIEGLASNRSS